MSILSGYKKFKKYLKTTDGYQLISYFTSSDTVNMVDENGNITDTTLTESINQVGKGRELTQAEYDALSEEEKKNGTVYYITDDEGVVSVVALTRETYEALGNTTLSDGRIYLITDENMEETASNIKFNNTTTSINSLTVQEAIEDIDSNLNNWINIDTSGWVIDSKWTLGYAIYNKATKNVRIGIRLFGTSSHTGDSNIITGIQEEYRPQNHLQALISNVASSTVAWTNETISYGFNSAVTSDGNLNVAVYGGNKTIYHAIIQMDYIAGI